MKEGSSLTREKKQKMNASSRIRGKAEINSEKQETYGNGYRQKEGLGGVWEW